MVWLSGAGLRIQAHVFCSSYGFYRLHLYLRVAADSKTVKFEVFQAILHLLFDELNKLLSTMLFRFLRNSRNAVQQFASLVIFRCVEKSRLSGL